VLPVDGLSSGSSTISVTSGGAQSKAASVPTATVNPALFTVSGTGAGQAVALNADGSANSFANPAARGRVLRLFATGLGITSSVSGTVTPTAAITAQVEGAAAQVSQVAPAGNGYPSGYFAIDVVVPAGAPADDFVLVTIAAGNTSSQNGVTVSLR
jgi:uncharacterized protein (TIGR03437 family)